MVSDDESSDGAVFLKLRVSDRKIERLASVKGRNQLDSCGPMGLTPDQSFVIVTETQTTEVYALDWQAP